MNPKIYFTTIDPEGREIILHDTTWWRHIKKYHPEIRSVSEIKSIIQNPDFITEISSRSSLAYTKIARSNLNVNVFAKMDNTYEKGYVTTSYLTSKDPDGSIIWVQS